MTKNKRCPYGLFDPFHHQLYEESAKIRSLAYLIENQREIAATPLDYEDIGVGLGLILSDAAKNIRAVATALDEMESHQRKSKPGAER